MNIFLSLNKTGRLKTTAGTHFWPRHIFFCANLRNWPNRSEFSFRRQPQKCKLATWNEDDEVNFPANTRLNLICGQILLRWIIVLPITGWKRDAHLFMRRVRWKKSERERRRRFSLCDSFSDRLLKSHGNIFLNILHKNKSDFCPRTMRVTQKRWQRGKARRTIDDTFSRLLSHLSVSKATFICKRGLGWRDSWPPRLANSSVEYQMMF